MSEYRVISSDNHVVEPPNLWTGRIESKFKDRAPQIVREDGADWWVCDGIRVVSVHPGTQTGRRFEEPKKMTRQDTFENVRPGGYIPEEHIKDLDVDGMDVSIVYPSVGLLLYRIPDGQLLDSVFRVYNDWLAEFCTPFPERIKGIAMVNVDDINLGVRELERCHKLGLAGAMITVYPPEDRAYHLPEYESLWAAAQDLGMPLSFHISTNRPARGEKFPAFRSLPPAYICNADNWVRMSLGHMIFSGVCERYPKIQVGAVEHEMSWIPHFLDRLDYTYTQRAPSDFTYRYKEEMLPSDYFHRNVFVGFQEDALGIKDRHIIGIDTMQWGSDYPHQESTFPRSQQILDEILSDCTEEEKSKIVGGNAARVYHLD